jgi:hypothetical protein
LLVLSSEVRALIPIAALLAALASGCGGDGGSAAETASKPDRPLTGQRVYGSGADAVHVLFPKRRPWRCSVVYFHGHGDPAETTPVHHRPLLDHLTARGSVVLFPRYETAPGGSNAAQHALNGVRIARSHVPELASVPLVGMGYSRGGHLVVDYAAIAPTDLKPRAILSFMPASSEDTPIDLRGIPHGTPIEIVAAEDDEIVGVQGAIVLIGELAQAGYQRSDVNATVVASEGGFQATHLSIFDRSPAAKRAYWRPADRIVERICG